MEYGLRINLAKLPRKQLLLSCVSSCTITNARLILRVEAVRATRLTSQLSHLDLKHFGSANAPSNEIGPEAQPRSASTSTEQLNPRVASAKSGQPESGIDSWATKAGVGLSLSCSHSRCSGCAASGSILAALPIGLGRAHRRMLQRNPFTAQSVASEAAAVAATWQHDNGGDCLDLSQIDSRLIRLIAAWPMLPQHVKQTIEDLCRQRH